MRYVAYDTETTGLNAWKGDAPFAFGFQWDDGKQEYYDFRVDPWTREVEYVPRFVRRIRDILEDESVAKVMHHKKFDERVTENALGIRLRGPTHDTMFMAHAFHSQEESFGLKPLSEKRLRYPKEDLDLLKKATRRLRRLVVKKDSGLGKPWNISYITKTDQRGEEQQEAQVEADYWIANEVLHRNPKLLLPGEAELCQQYCLGDCERTLLLFFYYRKLLKEDSRWQTYLMENKRLAPVVYRMEARGVGVSPEKLDSEITTYRAKAKECEKYVVDRAWDGFNIQSHHDVAALLFDPTWRGLPVHIRTKSGGPATKVEHLRDHLSDKVVFNILAYKAYSKAASGFFGAYQRLMTEDPLVKKGYCVHANFNQVGPTTGRFSCREPNLQNAEDATKTRSVVPVHARTAFGPRPGYRWLLIDYAQLELVIFADICEEMFLIKAFETGRDVMDEVANKIWGGKGNPRSISQAAKSLGLSGARKLTPELAAVHQRLGIKNLSALTPRDYPAIVTEWLSWYDYSLTAAEKEAGHKMSRGMAKIFMYTKIFGGGAKAVMKLMSCTNREARKLQGDYDDAFPRIKTYMKARSKEAKRDGGVYNRYGRWLPIDPGYDYRAVNYEVQSFAADKMKRAMIACDAYLRSEDIDGHLIMTVHDELIFEIAIADFKKPVIRSLASIMRDDDGLLNHVKLKVGVEYSDTSWAETKKVEWYTN